LLKSERCGFTILKANPRLKRASEVEGDLYRRAGIRGVAKRRLAHRKTIFMTELAEESFIAHNVVSPYREVVIREFHAHKAPLHIDVEMPTVETIRKLVQSNSEVAFLPRMCVAQEIEQGLLCEMRVKEMQTKCKIRLVYPTRRALSHAGRAFLELLG
jgi:DNA-binding transcriptional LysR family regulator